DDEYSSHNFSAQRRFPNEELSRFMGRNFFHLPINKRNLINILDVGCGSGANLWMLAREGFNAKGIDISENAIKLCRKLVKSYGGNAEFYVGSMTDLPFETGSMDAIVDVFSSNCLTSLEGNNFLKEVLRTLKVNGKFFSYFPSANSDAWVKANSTDILDKYTLKGIYRKESPFFGNYYPFRFLGPMQYQDILKEVGFSVTYLETTSRTYNKGKEYFEFSVVEAIKI
ncbi:class I SAM-dependent methyltransferase, partial [Alphaproteobacteria bacterium]|nr:class I SAM-dependent methyltransferase [Alphaproteobacteria bacterium]